MTDTSQPTIGLDQPEPVKPTNRVVPHVPTDNDVQDGESSDGSNFQKALTAWRGMHSGNIGRVGSLTKLATEIGLSQLVPQLDSTATEIVTHQKESVLARKDLAQKTKDFRKLDDAAKLVEYKALLKGQSPRGSSKL